MPRARPIGMIPTTSKNFANAPMPSPEEITKHEHAAGFIMELRRRGVPCHVEKHSGMTGEHVDVIIDQEPQHSGQLPEPGH